MNQEQIAKLKELAQAAENEVIRSHGWAGSVEMLDTLRIDEEYLTAASPAAILELIALAEHSLSAQDEVPGLVEVGEMIELKDQDDPRFNTILCEWDNEARAKLPHGTKIYAATPSPSLAVRDVVAATPAPIQQGQLVEVGQMIEFDDYEDPRFHTIMCDWDNEARAKLPAGTKIYAALAGSQVQAAGDAPVDPMDWPLPCDVKVGHGTHRKGCTLGSLVARMKVLYDMVQDTQPRLTNEQRNIMQKYFGAKPNADCSGEPENCPDNEGYGCACDPMNKEAATTREQP